MNWPILILLAIAWSALVALAGNDRISVRIKTKWRNKQ